MKVKIIKANGIKEKSHSFNFEVLQQYIDKVISVPNPLNSSTGDYTTTGGSDTTGSDTTGAYWTTSDDSEKITYTVSSSTTSVDFAKLISTAS